ncbi:MAG: hypothetical protein ABIL09_11625, partial [Gemmatimonadota bacterium]
KAKLRGERKTLRETLIGPEPTPMTQQALGARQRATVGARAVEARAIAEFAKRVEPIAARYAAQAPKAKQRSTAEAVRRLLFHLAEAGPEGAAAKATMPFDPLRRHFKYAERAGLAADPQVQSLLREHWARMAPLVPAEKAAGMPVGRIPYYTGRPMTPEAQARLAAQQTGGFRKPGEAPGLLSLRQGPGMQRAYFRLFQVPGRAGPEAVLSSAHDAKARVAALKAMGAKEVGQAPVSAAQWNLWARSPKTSPVAFGPEAIGPPIKGGIFKESLPEAAGQRLAAHERSMAAAQTRDLVEPWGIDLPRGVKQKDPRFAQFTRPKRPQQNNPMAALEQTRLYDRVYPKEVSDIINSMTETFDTPEAIERVLGASDRILGVWKSAQLYHPSYGLRNAVEKPLGVAFAGGDPLDATIKAFTQFSRQMRDALFTNNPALVEGASARFGGRTYGGRWLYDFLRARHGIGGGRTAIEMPTRFGGPTAQAIGGARRGWQRVHSAVFRMNQWMEDHQKLGAFFHFLDRGVDPEDAWMRTLLAAPDLADLPVWSSSTLGRLFPWYRWRLKNGTRMLTYVLPQKPGWLTALPKFRNFVEGMAGVERVPEELRPGWMEEGAYAQFMGGREGGAAFGLQTWFPGQEAYDVLGIPLAPERAAQRLAGELHPFAKAGIEAATGTSIFRQTPLQTVQEAGGWGRALPQAFMGQSGTALDAALALRPFREWLPGGRVSEMETPGRAVTRAVLGGAV